MSRADALAELIAKVEAGEATMVDIHAALQRNGLNATSAYNGSLDAALALHQAVLPGWGWGCQNCGTPFTFVVNDDVVHEARADTPARAWLLAILKALHAQEPTP